MIAASKETTLERIATAIIEDKMNDIDIVKYVEESFKNCEGSFEWLK